MFSVILLATTWFASSLVGQPLERAVNGFVTQEPAVVVLFFGPDDWDSVPRSIVGAGFARIVERRTYVCNNVRLRYVPSQALLDIGGWRIARFARNETRIIIPVGSYRYFAHSAEIGVLQPTYAFIDAMVRLVPNANVQTLEFLAPVTAWSVS